MFPLCRPKSHSTFFFTKATNIFRLTCINVVLFYVVSISNIYDCCMCCEWQELYRQNWVSSEVSYGMVSWYTYSTACLLPYCLWDLSVLIYEGINSRCIILYILYYLIAFLSLLFLWSTILHKFKLNILLISRFFYLLCSSLIFFPSHSEFQWNGHF